VYYSDKAVALCLAVPQFNQSVPSVGKTIVANKIAEVLGYEFKAGI
jgi:hypothetical protein